MNARNPFWVDPGHTILDLEIEHPVFGWIPFTASPTDVEPHGRQLYEQAIAGDFGPVAEYTPPVLTVAQQLAQYERDLDDFLDAKAKELTFKDRHSLALRGGYPNRWQAIGAAFGTWMDDCNDRAWDGMQEILAGTRPMPETKEAFLAELPPFVMPS